MNDTYAIHHWRILWSNHWKLAWMGFEPITTKFCSNALTTGPSGHQLKSNSKPTFFLQLLQFHRLLSVKFHLGYCLHHICLSWNVCNIYIFWINFFLLILNWINRTTINLLLKVSHFFHNLLVNVLLIKIFLDFLI